MKKFILFIFFLGSFSMYAQVIDVGDFGLRLRSDQSNTITAKGSPYLQKEFEEGVVKIPGKDPLRVLMRYDVATEQIEIKIEPGSEDIYILPAGKDIQYEIGGMVFQYDHINFQGKSIGGYFLQHYNGNNYRLLEKHRVERTEAVKPKNSYERSEPARIDIKEDYFIVNSAGEVWKVRAKSKDLKDSFNSSEVKNYLSDNKIKSINDVTNFVAFLDKQVN